jgi:chromosome segregation ATPase
MNDREEYVERMKKQLDEWNAKLAALENDVHKAQANMRAKYQAQIDAMHRQRDETLKKIEEARVSGQAAWKEVSKGADEAWKTLHASFEKAWSEFHGKKP